MDAHLDLELSAYLDGELAADERTRVEAHLAGCGQCRDVLDGLRRVSRRARALEDRPPAKDLWAGIASRIVSAPTTDVVPLASRRRRISFSMPQLAAAAVALMMVSGAGVALLLNNESTPSVPSVPSVTSVTLTAPADSIVLSYDAVIRELQTAVDARRGRLDTATVRVLEQSLQLIDMAIAQATAALARDPNNTYLNGHLQRSLDRKMHLLERVAALPTAS